MRDPISRLLSATNAEIGGGAKSFRSLWSGLDIIRKALGSSRLQSVQTTAIDAASGDHQPDRPPGPRIRRMDRFGLASLSFGTHGELVPRSPMRGGRYALFTLVGIAGEDDLDAPDQNGPRPRAISGGNGQGFSESSRPHQGNRRELRPPFSRFGRP
jgi:hypothetical protein